MPVNQMEKFHRPVLLNETIELLAPQPGGIYVDGTLGAGGHAEAILERIQPDGRLIGIDRDEDALEVARQRLSRFGKNVTIVKANFADVDEVLAGFDIGKVDGMVLDLGVSSYQLTGSPERGFSFTMTGPLDMRMDRTEPLTCEQILAEISEEELADILYRYADERWARRIAKAIVERRKVSPIKTTTELADIVASAVPKRFHPKGVHPATRTFLALRCYLNREIESLEVGLEAAARVLKVGGRICTLSYHSTEDRVIKRFFARASGKCQCAPGVPVCTCGAENRFMRVLTRKPVTASEAEIRENVRARSAKLRAAEKIACYEVRG